MINVEIATNAGTTYLVQTDELTAEKAIGWVARQVTDNAILTLADGGVIMLGPAAQVVHYAVMENIAAQVQEYIQQVSTKEGPLKEFEFVWAFKGQNVVVRGIEECYDVTEEGIYSSVLVPVVVNGRPALEMISHANLKALILAWIDETRYEQECTALVPPASLTWEQAEEYANDWIKETQEAKPHVAEEKNAKAWYGYKRADVAEE